MYWWLIMNAGSAGQAGTASRRSSRPARCVSRQLNVEANQLYRVHSGRTWPHGAARITWNTWSAWEIRRTTCCRHVSGLYLESNIRSLLL